MMRWVLLIVLVGYGVWSLTRPPRPRCYLCGRRPIPPVALDWRCECTPEEVEFFMSPRGERVLRAWEAQRRVRSADWSPCCGAAPRGRHSVACDIVTGGGSIEGRLAAIERERNDL